MDWIHLRANVSTLARISNPFLRPTRSVLRCVTHANKAGPSFERGLRTPVGKHRESSTKRLSLCMHQERDSMCLMMRKDAEVLMWVEERGTAEVVGVERGRIHALGQPGKNENLARQLQGAGESVALRACKAPNFCCLRAAMTVHST